MELALSWLAEDNQKRKQLEQEGVAGFRVRGRPKDGIVTDSETFYKKCGLFFHNHRVSVIYLRPCLADMITQSNIAKRTQRTSTNART